jgi:hypothetical protein
LLEGWNVNKNVPRVEFFQMTDREIARFGMSLQVVMKHVKTSDKKPSQDKPERSGDRDLLFISGQLVRTDNL